MPLTEYDFALFEPAPTRTSPAPQVKPRREPIHPVRPPKEEPLQSKNAKAHKVWMQSLVSYAIVSAVGLCMFAVIQTEVQHDQALAQQEKLYQQLSTVQQLNMSYHTQLERKYSLEVIQDVALNQYHMVPVEGGLVTYLNIGKGDQRLN